MTEAEIKKIVKEAVHETLLGIGLDMEDPTEVQQDFAFVRHWRTNSAAVKQQGFTAIVVAALVGLLGLVWTVITR